MEFDYVIAGAGAAGCVIARRLIEQSDATVLLLEAGGPDRLESIHATDVPTTTSMWGAPEVCWPYTSEPQPGLKGRVVPIPQGRVIGGGTSINAMLYVRGNPRDFDYWSQLGNAGWGYDDMVPYFKRAESTLTIRTLDAPSSSSSAFVRAARELGCGGGDAFDYNGERQDGGAFLYQSTREAADRRCSTATAYLNPILGHPRLVLRTGVSVARVTLRGTRAAGVEYVDDGQLVTAEAKAEVIVSCGALGTPKVLMLSGIGPATHLRDHGLDPVVDLPGVGRNLQDHMVFGVGWECLAEQPPPELLAEAGLFMRSRPGLDAASPDLQIFFGPVQFLAPRYQIDGPGFTFAPILAQPRSRGTVTLRSADPVDVPVIDPHYLEAAPDMDVLVSGIEIGRRMVGASAFDGLRGRELAPGAEVTSRAGLEDYVREQAQTVWHPAGTCQMGYGPDAVTDAQLRVHGIEALRVADASVMPTITTGNTQAPVIAIAERAADLILAKES
ncbi:MAG TPA: GMC family oxidoreductase N-terminal domain-containing protein [Streptosporangiaceae bacterium]|nr:GMC family oxidoreductase N-terminal domain-containing protein [Streptosporangiaceae bacterium]